MYFLLFTIAAAQTITSIHGRNVTADCVKAYTDAFAPELARTEKFEALAKAVAAPPELKTRSETAAKHLRTYQDLLKKYDQKLSDPLSDTEKKELVDAKAMTDDVGAVLAELSSNTDEAIKTAYNDFKTARSAEVDAGMKVDKSCPAGLD